MSRDAHAAEARAKRDQREERAADDPKSLHNPAGSDF